MAKINAMNKEAKIKRKEKELLQIFEGIDENKRKTASSLIKTAAFIAVSLEELQDIINAEGYTEEYQNGESQHGRKQSEAVKTHIAMTRNQATVVKQLLDLVPAAARKDSKLVALQRM